MSARRRSVLAAAVVAVGSLGLVLGQVSGAAATSYPQSAVVSANPVNWTPHILDGAAHTVLQVGNTVFVGGTFTQVAQVKGGAPIARRNFVAFRATDGLILPFNPAPSSGVWTLVQTPDGDVVAGGQFSSWGGQSAKRLVKFDPTTFARVTAFKPAASAAVFSARVAGSRLFIGGNFATVNGVARQGLADVNLTTGALDTSANLSVGVSRSATVVPGVQALDVSPDGRTLVVIGNFRVLGGQPREQIALVDVSGTPTVTSWSTLVFQRTCKPKFASYMRDVAFAPDGSYFVVVATGGNTGSFPNGGCDAASRWESGRSGAGQLPTWVDWTGGDTLTAVAVTGEAIYVGGHQRWMNNPYVADQPGPGAVSREGLAALDPDNGMPLPWNPTRTRGVGVGQLVPTAGGLWIVSDTDRLAVEYHGRVGYFPLAGGAPRLHPTYPTLPGTLYSVTSSGALVKQSFNGATAGSATTVAGSGWSGVQAAVMTAGKVYTASSDGVFRVRTFNGTTAGPPLVVGLLGLDAKFPVAKVRAMTLSGGRLYYTLAGDKKLYARALEVDGDLIGAQTLTASTTGWSNVTGLFVAGGTAYYTTSTGALWRVGWNHGPAGAATQVGSGWTGRSLFLGTP